MKKAALILLLVLFVFVVANICFFINRPYNSCVTAEGIEKVTSCGDTVLVKTSDEFYEIRATDDFGRLFSVNSWEITNEKPMESVKIAFSFAEEWILELHTGGKATAYYGYASSKEKRTAYYNVPVEIADKLTNFVRAHGESKNGLSYRSAFYY